MATMVSLEEELKNKVLIASAISLPEPGGVSNYVDALIKTPIINKVISFNFYNPKKSEIKGKYYLLQKVYFNNTKLSFFLRILIMAYFIRKYGKNKIIYAMDASIAGLAASLSFKPYIVRWVGDFSYESYYTHKIFASTLEHYLEKRKDWKYYLQRWVLKRATLIIVPSNYLKNILMQYYYINKEKIKVIENFANLPERKIKKLNPDSIIFIGRLVALKQPHLALKIHLAISNYNIKTYIIGEGVLKEVIEKIVKKLKLSNVYIEGYKSKKEILKYLRKAYFVIIPSVYEGQSFTALEAMKLEIPVLLREIDANKELVGKNYAYFFNNQSEMVDKAIKLINKRQFIKKQKLEKYSWRRHYIYLLRFLGNSTISQRRSIGTK